MFFIVFVCGKVKNEQNIGELKEKLERIPLAPSGKNKTFLSLLAHISLIYQRISQLEQKKHQSMIEFALFWPIVSAHFLRKFTEFFIIHIESKSAKWAVQQQGTLLQKKCKVNWSGYQIFLVLFSSCELDCFLQKRKHKLCFSKNLKPQLFSEGIK